MKMIWIQVFEELFQFASMADWVSAAQIRFRNHGHTSQTAICVDSNGMVCVRGKQFATAVYPVRVFALDEAPYEPCGMQGSRDPNQERGEE